MRRAWRGRRMRRTGGPGALAALLAALVTAPLLAACGGDTGARLRWFVVQESSGAFRDAAAGCSAGAGGRYEITVEALPATSDQQRQLLVRRLAARDSTVDLIGMDVIWTAEFAEAGWLLPWQGARAREATRGVLPGPLATATYRDSVWAAPLTSNTQLLWYRKSRVPRPPATWDQLIDQAEQLPAGANRVEVQGGRFEGYTVWVNSLLASAGTELVADAERPERASAGLDDARTRRALEVVRRLAASPAADPSLATATEESTRLAFQSGEAAFAVAYPTLWAAARAASPEVFADLGYAPYPAVLAGGPSRPPLGGLNLGVSSFTAEPDAAFEAAACLRSATNQKRIALGSGLPPTLESVYDDADVARQFPFADLLRRSLADAAPRPATPAYRDVSLAVQRVLHPPAGVDPDGVVPRLRKTINDALASQALL